MTFAKFKLGIGACGACFAEILGKALGGWDAWAKTILAMIILDYITGFLAAAVNKKLSSSTGSKGVAKKILILCLVAVAYLLDNLWGMNGILRFAVIGFYIAQEGLSIVENCGSAGLPIPAKLKELLEQLRDQCDDDSEVGGK